MAVLDFIPLPIDPARPQAAGMVNSIRKEASTPTVSPYPSNVHQTLGCSTAQPACGPFPAAEHAPEM
jgi:hypothetical protein